MAKPSDISLVLCYKAGMQPNFMELLENQHNWPGDYEFRFVIPTSSLSALKQAFKGDLHEIRPSAKGNYVSFTCRKFCLSAEEVIAKYEELRGIDGLISL